MTEQFSCSFCVWIVLLCPIFNCWILFTKKTNNARTMNLSYVKVLLTLYQSPSCCYSMFSWITPWNYKNNSRVSWLSISLFNYLTVRSDSGQRDAGSKVRSIKIVFVGGSQKFNFLKILEHKAFHIMLYSNSNGFVTVLVVLLVII